MAHGLTSGILVYYSGDYPLPGSSIAGSQRSQRSPWSWCEVGVVDPAGFTMAHGAHGARVNAYQVEATMLCASAARIMRVSLGIKQHRLYASHV
jgi:hypothetical protein